MPSRPPVHTAPGRSTRADRQREHDRQRGSASARGYSYRWQKAREAFLNDPNNCLCAMCLKEGRTTEATVVDHIIPHKGDYALFWDRGNWQGLCEWHHNSVKKSQEMTGRIRGCDVNGNSLDPNHHWNRGRS